MRLGHARHLWSSAVEQSSSFVVGRVSGPLFGDLSCVCSAIVSGPERLLSDANSLFFKGGAKIENLGSCRGWSAESASLKFSKKTDMFRVVQQPLWASTKREDAVFFRNTVDSRMPHTASFEAYLGRVSKSVRQSVRKAESAGLKMTYSTQFSDLKFFYDYMMVPLGKTRHGKLNWLPSFDEFAVVWPHLVLGFVEKDGKRVAGELLLKTKAFNRITEWRFGMNEEILADSKLLDLCNNFCTAEFMRYAIENSFDEISMGQVVSILSNGILRFKRKWDSCFVPILEYPLYSLHVNPSQSMDFFSRVPLIAERGGILEVHTGVRFEESIEPYIDLLKGSVWEGLRVFSYVPSKTVADALQAQADKLAAELQIVIQD